MEQLSFKEQENQYEKNFQHLEKITGKDYLFSMSHPCGSYNDDTLSILSKMGIKIGFRSSLNNLYIKSNLEIPREDHANIINKMN
jgi:hypothetical protein